MPRRGKSHPLRHQEPVIKPITGSFLFPKRAIPCSFTFSERKSSVLPNINRCPPAFEVAAPRQSKPCLHRLCRGDFRLVIQVGVDVRRGGEVAVPQPLLNVFEGDAVGQQQAGTAMTHVVKSNMFRADFFDDPVVKSAESVRVPRFTRARRWE